jgi:hypothetical protein
MGVDGLTSAGSDYILVPVFISAINIGFSADERGGRGGWGRRMEGRAKVGG